MPVAKIRKAPLKPWKAVQASKPKWTTMPKILKTMPKAKQLPKAVPKKLKRKMYT